MVKRQKRFGDSEGTSENKTAPEYFLSKINVKIMRGEYAEIQDESRLLIRDFIEEQLRPWCQTNNNLDTTSQAELTRLLLALEDARGLALLFISHDLPLVRRICPKIISLPGRDGAGAGRSPGRG